MKLTQVVAKTLQLPEGKTDYTMFDDDLPGFGLRLRAGGSRVWVFQYGRGQQQRKMTLGRVSAIDAAMARKAAQTLYAKVKLGEDPGRAKIDARARAHETFGHFLPRYLE